MSATPAVSVVVPVFDGAEDLRRLLEALRAQTVPPSSFEVIVVDDGSTDATPAVAEASPGVRLVRTANGGSYAARNAGVAAARAAVLAFTDADCVPAPDWIERGLEGLSPPDVDALAGSIEIEIAARPTLAGLVDAACFLDQLRYVEAGWGATANLWIPHALVESLGGFADHLRSGGDKEFGTRLTSAGHRLRYAPGVRIGHPARDETAQLVRKAFRIGRGSGRRSRRAQGRVISRHHYWVHPSVWWPRPLEPRDVERLRERGIDVTPALQRRLAAVRYLAIQLPTAVGAVIGTLR